MGGKLAALLARSGDARILKLWKAPGASGGVLVVVPAVPVVLVVLGTGIEAEIAIQPNESVFMFA